MARDESEDFLKATFGRAHSPTEIICLALPRHLNESLRRLARRRLEAFAPDDLAPAVPFLISFLQDESGLSGAVPGWRYAPDCGPWPPDDSIRLSLQYFAAIAAQSPRPLRPALADLSRDELAAAYVLAGGGDEDDVVGQLDYMQARGVKGRGGGSIWACQILSDIADVRSVPILTSLFASAEIHVGVRREAGRSLNCFTTPRVELAAPACLAMVLAESASPAMLRLKWQAVRLLGRIGSPLADPAVPALVNAALFDDARILPALAAIALGGIATPDARKALEQLVCDPRPDEPARPRRDPAGQRLTLEAALSALGRGPEPKVPDPDSIADCGFAGREHRGHLDPRG